MFALSVSCRNFLILGRNKYSVRLARYPDEEKVLRNIWLVSYYFTRNGKVKLVMVVFPVK